jgi:hypothetical protein
MVKIVSTYDSDGSQIVEIQLQMEDMVYEKIIN